MRCGAAEQWAVAAVLALTVWPLAGCGKVQPDAAPPAAPTASAGAEKKAEPQAAPAATETSPEITDEDVRRAIERGREWLLEQQNGGAWPEQPNVVSPEPCGTSELAVWTLAACGMNPQGNPTMSAALALLLDHPSEKTYAVSMRALALSREMYVTKTYAKREAARAGAVRDVTWLVNAQGRSGGWGPVSLEGGDGPTDLGHTHVALLALRADVMQGCEVPMATWQRAYDFLCKTQQPDGSWPAGDVKAYVPAAPGYGPATAAGVDGLYIVADELRLWPGFPCAEPKKNPDLMRRIAVAMAWLSKEFAVEREADVVLTMKNHPASGVSPRFYWLYAVERAAMQSGYRYLGAHDCYAEGAEYLLAQQQPDGSWGDIPSTCLAILFLQAGRVPVLINKLALSPTTGWDSHPRDVARATEYVVRFREQSFQWQVVNLKMPLEELREAPILYLSAETPPKFTAEEKKILRTFTDTGGTILIEAACGSAAVRQWFSALAREIWPEWPLKPLKPDHAIFRNVYRLKKYPELLGVDDGSRTVVFFSMDDISCAWQEMELWKSEYLFQLAENLRAYASEGRPMLGRLSAAKPPAPHPAGEIVAGPKKALSLVRLSYDDPGWIAGRNYRGFEVIQRSVTDRAGITLEVNEAGTRPPDLDGADVAFLTGADGSAVPELLYNQRERDALRDYLARGGFLWAEATAGSREFGPKFLRFAAAMKWTVEPLPKTHPVMSGLFASAVGRNITKVEFRRALKIERLGRPAAELLGIYQDGRLVGVYSPFDVVFSTTGYPAYGCRGYASEDAKAVAANILLYLSDRRELDPPKP